jgi:hypothetical protein
MSGPDEQADWAFVRNEAEAAFRFLHECWIGTGRSMEDGSASHDFKVWKDRAYRLWQLADDREKSA